MADTFYIESSFKNGELIPSQHAYSQCGGDNISPELTWHGAPENTQSFAVICRDPDARGGDFVHWGIFNIPGTARSVEQSVPHGRKIFGDWYQVSNDYGKDHKGYDGPCPPKKTGTHRYIFTVYALDKMLDPDQINTVPELEHAIKDHILVQATLTGLYTTD